MVLYCWNAELDGCADFAQPVGRDYKVQVFLLHACYRDLKDERLVAASHCMSRMKGLPPFDRVRRRRLRDDDPELLRGSLTESASDCANAT